MTRLKLLFASYVLTLVALFFYSLTQIDLSLTFSKLSIWQTIEKSFQQIGYFNRPLSTAIFLIILTLLFIHYFAFIFLAIKKRISRKQAWFLVLAGFVVLVFSYNAFSYDLFNYIFDAKIITHYHLNPYLYKALDFPNDPMLSFMRWTHRYYPYGPAWLFLTAPISFIGLNIFSLTFFLFKIFISSFFLGTVYFIEKIVKKVSPGNEIYALVFFGLSPLVLIESVLSVHNDIVMMFFAVLGLYLILNKKFIFSLIAIIFSYLIKEVTILLLLPILIFQNPIKKIALSLENFFRLCVLVMIAGFAYVLTKLEVQPWYFLWIIPFISLLKPNRYIFLLTSGVSLGLLLRYTPFLYQGDWNGAAIPIKFYVSIITPAVFLVFGLVWGFIRKIRT